MKTLSLLPSSFPLVLCVASKWSVPLKGTYFILSLKDLSPSHSNLTSVLHFFVFFMSSFYLKTASIPFSHAYLRHFFCLFCRKTHKHSQTNMETCMHSADDLLAQWERLAVPMVTAFLSVCTADTDTHTMTQHAGTLFPHQRNCANSPDVNINGEERRWEERRGFIYTLAWCRSTPYMDNFLAFSRNWVSACAGVNPLKPKKDKINAKTFR